MKLKSLIKVSRNGCPVCLEGRLLTMNWIRATMMDEIGGRYPDSWTYYLCDKCGFRTKVFLDGRTEAPTEEEWEMHCGNESQRRRH